MKQFQSFLNCLDTYLDAPSTQKVPMICLEFCFHLIHNREIREKRESLKPFFKCAFNQM